MSQSSSPGKPSIVVDDSTFQPPIGEFETVVVAGSQVAEITMALEAAGERFYSVTERGDEYSEADWDTVVEELYTPNYVGPVEVTAQGLSLYVDCQGEISNAMRAKFIEVLVEELEGHGVTDARIFSPRSN